MVSGYNGRSLSHGIDGRTLKHDDKLIITDNIGSVTVTVRVADFTFDWTKQKW